MGGKDYEKIREFIDKESLDWALKHLTVFYDSDFFPKLFEFRALKHNWPNVKKEILESKINEDKPKATKISAAPKSNHSFRIVHQLHPLDAIFYTALIHKISDEIEKFRIPEDEQIAFSYRISINQKGSFFNEKENGWKDFLGATENLTKEICQFEPKSYVLTTDIADFYNQIYLHRVQNIIEEAGFKKIRCQAANAEK